MDFEVRRRIKRNWDALAKPLDGLGNFERAICDIGGIQRSDRPSIAKRAVVVMCSDNGIVEEGISQTGKEATLAVAKALGQRTSSACRFAALANADVFPIDVGVDCEEMIPGVQNSKIARGTKNFAKEPAMTEEQTLGAVKVGIEAVGKLFEQGYNLLVAGEMGIGNTTTSAAVLAALAQQPAENVVGPGAGLDSERLAHKLEVVKNAIEKYDLYYRKADYKETWQFCLRILTCVGGFDIAALAGLYIGGMLYGIPVLIDGFVSATAAFVAQFLAREPVNSGVATNLGREPGCAVALDALLLTPIYNANVSFGEGVGAIMTIPTLDMALDYYLNGAKFEDLKLDPYKRFKK